MTSHDLNIFEDYLAALGMDQSFFWHVRRCEQIFSQSSEFQYPVPDGFNVEAIFALPLAYPLTAAAIAELGMIVAITKIQFNNWHHHSQTPDADVDNDTRERQEEGYKDFKRMFAGVTLVASGQFSSAFNPFRDLYWDYLQSHSLPDQRDFRGNVDGGYGVDASDELVQGGYLDNYHHLIQKSINIPQLAEARDIFDRCFVGESESLKNQNIKPYGGGSDWNKKRYKGKNHQHGGVNKSSVNGEPLNPWFHTGLNPGDKMSLHTKIAAGNLNRFLLTLAGKVINKGSTSETILNGVAKACKIDTSKHPCEQVRDLFENKLKPYLQQKNYDYKEKLKKILLDYLEENKDLSNVKEIYQNGKVIAEWVRIFQNPQGQTVEVIDMNRILYNKSKQPGGRGLTEAQREEVKKRMRAELNKDADPKEFQPEYVRNDFEDDDEKDVLDPKSGLEKFCEKVSEYMDGRTPSKEQPLRTDKNLKDLGFKLKK